MWLIEWSADHSVRLLIPQFALGSIKICPSSNGGLQVSNVVVHGPPGPADPVNRFLTLKSLPSVQNHPYLASSGVLQNIRKTP